MLPQEYQNTIQNLIFEENTPEEDKYFINSDNGFNLFYKIWRDTWKMW